MAAILRYLYLKTAKMQQKSVQKFVICINRKKTSLTDFSLKLIAVSIIILFYFPGLFHGYPRAINIYTRCA